MSFSFAADKDWSVVSSTAVDGKSIDLFGNKHLSGNGHIGLRGTLDEFGKDQKTAVIINGLYDRVGDKWREPVNAPNAAYVQILYKGTALSADKSTFDTHEQGLDFRNGIQFRRTVFKTGDGVTITVSSRRFVSLASERLICVEYRVSASAAAELTLRTGINGDVWDLNGPHLRDFSAGTAAENGNARNNGSDTHAADSQCTTTWLAAKTAENGTDVVVAEAVSVQGIAGEYAQVREPQKLFRDYVFKAEAGKEYVFHKFAVVWDGTIPALSKNDALAGAGANSTAGIAANRGAARNGSGRASKTAESTVESATALAAAAAGKGFEYWLQKQSELWQARWDLCDVDIEGDPEARHALRFSMYHLLAIAPAFAEALSIPARGLSGQVYKGAIFWDTEIFMQPFFQNVFPEIARSLLMYRVRTLDGARRKAAEYGYDGAYYAWESQETGDDACTDYNINDVITGRPMRTHFRDKQIHISADVAFAVWDYFKATGDERFLLDGGAEVLYETARFLASWSYYKWDKDRYEVLDVTGPDEYHERVNNNLYTNLVTKTAFDAMLACDALLAQAHPAARAGILTKTGMEKLVPKFAEIRDKLYVPQPDPGTGLISQFDGYFAMQDISPKDLVAKRLHENEYLGGGNGLARWTQVLKQADVVLTLCLFKDRYDLQTKKANWEYYLPRTEHGSSLSACAYAMVAAEIGQADWAYKYFLKTATVDLTGDSKQYVGDLYIGGTHPAANGGAWLSVYRGFCGISADTESLRVKPALPANWKSVTLTVRSGRRLVQVGVFHDRVELKARGAFDAPLKIAIGVLIPGNGTAGNSAAAGGEELWDGKTDIVRRI